MDPVSDLRDTRVLIPRLRRAIGNEALSDEQINAMAADAIAAVIFYSGSLLGSELQVSERDTIYQSPIAWLTEPALSEAVITTITAQAALDYFFNRLSNSANGKTAETIKDEATEWTWEVSAQTVVERLRQLKSDRDLAIQNLEEEGMETDSSWTSFIAVRDQRTSRLVENWVEGNGGIGGMGEPGGIVDWYDYGFIYP